ncbi:MAG: hypothetical protein OXF30_03335 [Candidatus Saccharibacteria bacterium]|nr:hypothetical protein [Candidatus Saccharibacteria bacterium]
MFLVIDESKSGSSTTVGCLCLPDSDFAKAEAMILDARIRERCWGEIKWQDARGDYASKYTRILADYFNCSDRVTFHSLTYKKLGSQAKSRLKRLFPDRSWDEERVLDRRTYQLIRTVIWKCRQAGYDSSYYIIGDRRGSDDNSVYRTIGDLLAKDSKVRIKPQFCSTGTSAVLGSLQIADLCAGAIASCYEVSYHQLDTQQIKAKLIEINKNVELTYSPSRLPKLHDHRLHHWLFDETRSRFYGLIK